MKGTAFKYLTVLLLLQGILLLPARAQSSVEHSGISFRESVWLQVERHLFIPGEVVSFQATLLERDSYHLSELSRNIRVELLDSTGNKLFKQNIELVNARTSGKINLPQDLPSGWYYLRSYTNWMRNFSNSEYSVLPIKVINPSDKKVYPDAPSQSPSQKPIGKNPAMQITRAANQLTVEFRNENATDNGPLRLLVHRTSSWYWIDSTLQSGNPIVFKVPLDQIPKGIVQFSIVSVQNKVLARQLWSDYNPDECQLSLKTTTEDFTLRNNYLIEYQLPPGLDLKEKPGLQCHVALAEPGFSSHTVIPGLPGWNADANIPANAQDFQQWLSSHSYPDECVLSFFDKNSSIPVAHSLNNLPPLSKPGIRFLPETRAGILSGMVINKESGEPVPNTGIGITILNDNTFDAVKTNRDGVFVFAFPGRHDSRDYVLNFISEPDSSWVIEVFPDYDNKPFVPVEKPFCLSPEELTYAANLNINFKLKEIYSPSESSVPGKRDSVKKQEIFFDPPDRTILTDKYIELANVLEVVYEVVPDVQVRRKGNKSFISVYNKNSFAHELETLILLDGIPLTQHTALLELPPARIKRIEVKNKVYLHGNYLFASVVNFISRNEDFAGLKLPEKSIIGSFNLPGSPQSPDLQEIEQLPVSYPILNPVLLWEKTLTPEIPHVSFSTNDLYGTFMISVYGFDSKGQWIFGYKEVKVQRSNL